MLRAEFEQSILSRRLRHGAERHHGLAEANAAKAFVESAAYVAAAIIVKAGALGLTS